MLDTVFTASLPMQKTVLENTLGTFQALLTPMIAIVTCYIAWAQWQMNMRKYKSDIYDRRLKIYQLIQSHILKIIQTSKTDFPEIYQFYSQTAEADFLFPKEFRKYIDEIHANSVNLHIANEQYCDSTMVPPSGYDHLAVCNQKHIAMKWFQKQHKHSKQLFQPYLSLHE